MAASLKTYAPQLIYLPVVPLSAGRIGKMVAIARRNMLLVKDL
jgi:hypothetical protein